MKIRSISKHLLVTQALLLTLLVFMFAGGLYSYVRGVLYNKLERQLAEDAQALSLLIEIERWTDKNGVQHREIDIETDDFQLPAYEQDDQGNGYIFLNAKGEVVTQSPYADSRFIDLAEKRRALQGEVRILKIQFLPRKAGADEPKWSLVVYRSTQEIQEILSSIMLGSILCGSVLVVLAVAACWWSVRSGVSPVNDLAHEVSEVDVTDLSYRVELAQLPEELRPVGEKLNDLLERIETAFARERRFSASAAHELRTPLAELKAILQVGDSMAEGNLKQMFQDGDEVVQKMESLLVTLLTLMGGRSEELSLKEKSIHLVEFLQKRIEENAEGYPDTQIALELDGANAQILADEGLLSRVMDNLINNALSYADEGTSVRVWSQLDNDRASIVVSNQCSLLEEGDREFLTEPFWRKDAARSGGEHLGLGLNLVKKYCEVMGWQLTIGGKLPEVEITVSGIQLQ